MYPLFLFSNELHLQVLDLVLEFLLQELVLLVELLELKDLLVLDLPLFLLYLAGLTLLQLELFEFLHTHGGFLFRRSPSIRKTYLNEAVLGGDLLFELLSLCFLGGELS